MSAQVQDDRQAAGTASVSAEDSMPARAGVGLRAEHYADVLEQRPAVSWLEIHGENYFGKGGVPLRYVDAIAEHYPLSIHCVGLSLGSTDPLREDHVSALAALVDRWQPRLVSDHLCWGSVGGRYFNDLLPLPYTCEALAHMTGRVNQVQDALGRPILIENLSSYLAFCDDEMTEVEFLNSLARATGCGLLLDVNNVYVSACNHNFDAKAFISSVDAEAVGEIHLAGHAVNHVDGVDIRIDDHGSEVCEAVWDLYGYTIARLGPRPTLIEWDSNIPGLSVLAEQAHRAERYLDDRNALVA